MKSFWEKLNKWCSDNLLPCFIAAFFASSILMSILDLLRDHRRFMGDPWEFIEMNMLSSFTYCLIGYASALLGKKRKQSSDG
jgi:hypothetical protein